MWEAVFFEYGHISSSQSSRQQYNPYLPSVSSNMYIFYGGIVRGSRIVSACPRPSDPMQWGEETGG